MRQRADGKYARLQHFEQVGSEWPVTGGVDMAANDVEMEEKSVILRMTTGTDHSTIRRSSERGRFGRF